MGGRSRTADGRRCWRQWTEPEARAVLAEFAQSGESLASFARGRGVSTNRIRYWRKRLGETALVPSFVQVRLPAAHTEMGGERVEIVLDDVTVRIREEVNRRQLDLRRFVGRCRLSMTYGVHAAC